MLEKVQKRFNMSQKDLVYILLSIFVVAGIIGYIYEVIFYRFDLGYFVNRGTTFGPWIPVYGFGAIFIFLISYTFKENKPLTYILCFLISFVVEFLTGYVIYHVFHTRLWNYNTEILNLGNIGGYVCLRSILLFGCSGIILIYALVPIFASLLENTNTSKLFKYLSVILSLAFIFDIILSLAIKVLS